MYRHICLTRWPQMDPHSLAYFGGHPSFVTTRRYVHPNLEIGRVAVERARAVQAGHKPGHSAEMATLAEVG